MHLTPGHLGVGSHFRGFEAFLPIPLRKAESGGGGPGYWWHQHIPHCGFCSAFPVLPTHSHFQRMAQLKAKLCSPRRRHCGKPQSVPQLHQRVISLCRKTVFLPAMEQVWSSPERCRALHPIRAPRRKPDRVLIKSSSELMLDEGLF